MRNEKRIGGLRWAIRGALVLAIAGVVVGRHYLREIKLNPEAWRNHPNRRVVSRAMDLSFNATPEFSTSWLGVAMMQHPCDLMTYQELMLQLRPGVIVETGTAHGGLALYLASLAEVFGLPTRIVTVDIEDSYWRESLRAHPIEKKLLDRITFVMGDSVSREVIGKVEAAVGNAPALVILDSLHTREHVLKELEAYSRFVPAGGYVLVNDTTIGGVYLGRWRIEKIGPLYGVVEFLKRRPEFERVPGLPRFSVSCMHGGILRRKP